MWYLGSLVVAHGLSCPVTCRILVPRPGIGPMSLALEGRFSTTDPRGESPSILLSISSSTHLSIQPSFHPFHPFTHSKTGWVPTARLAHYWGSVVSASPTGKDLTSWGLPQKRDDVREETFVLLLSKHLSSRAIISMKCCVLFPGGT